jgi:hypothetical protein
MGKKSRCINTDIIRLGVNFKRTALNYLKWKGDYEERGWKREENKPHKWVESKTGWINVKCKLNGWEVKAKINYRRWKEQEAQREEGPETNKPKSDAKATWSNTSRWKKLKIFNPFLKESKCHRIVRKEARIQHKARCMQRHFEN